jgi:hypothetical protein
MENKLEANFSNEHLESAFSCNVGSAAIRAMLARNAAAVRDEMESLLGISLTEEELVEVANDLDSKAATEIEQGERLIQQSEEAYPTFN